MSAEGLYLVTRYAFYGNLRSSCTAKGSRSGRFDVLEPLPLENSYNYWCSQDRSFVLKKTCEYQSAKSDLLTAVIFGSSLPARELVVNARHGPRVFFVQEIGVAVSRT